MSDQVDDQVESKYRSRTLWLVIGFALVATGLVWFGKIDGAGWITTVIALFTGWQVRRYGDNKLRNGGR